MPTCNLVIEQGNVPVLQATVQDALTGLPRSNAVVSVTVTDSLGVQVTGVPSWPVALAYLAGSPGVYRVQLPTTAAFVPGQTYAATFVIVLDGVTTDFVYPLYVQPVGVPVADAPAPPGAYSPVSLWQCLQDAELAYHGMMIGNHVATIKDQNGEEVTYSIASRPALAQYIMMLKRQLNLIGPLTPAQVRFGPRSPWGGSPFMNWRRE